MGADELGTAEHRLEKGEEPYLEDNGGVRGRAAMSTTTARYTTTTGNATTSTTGNDTTTENGSNKQKNL